MKKLSSLFSGEIRQAGFTLIEIGLVLIISSILVGAIMSAYLSQQRTQTAQDQVVDIQQNLRGGMNFIHREIRMTGMDPTEMAATGISDAKSYRFQFTMDNNDNGAGNTPGDGDSNDDGETVTYGFLNGEDANNDGRVDSGVAPFSRLISGAGATPQPLADNVEAVEFLYLVEDSSSATGFTPVLNPTAGQYEDIRAVIISMLARTDTEDPAGAYNRISYRPASNNPDFHEGAYDISSGVVWGGVTNKFRRRMLISSIQLRNMGL